MRITIAIWLRGEEKLLKAIYESLIPDNVNIPEGMNVGMDLSGGSLRIKLSGDEKVKIDTLISTLNEVLEACEMIEKAMEEVEVARSQVY